MRLRHQLFQKCEKKSLKFDFCLLPLDGDGSAVPSFQLHPVFDAVSSRVPPGDATSRFVGFGDKDWDNFKNSFQTRGFESFTPRVLAASWSLDSAAWSNAEGSAIFVS